MKKILFLSVLAMASAHAEDVDYSRCSLGQGIYSAMLDNDGKIQPMMGSTIKNVKTEGKKETYSIESAGYMGKFTTEIMIERDAQGRVIKSQMGGDSMNAAQVAQFKSMMVNSSSGTAGVNEPTVYVSKDNQFHTAPVSDLTQEQAKEMGYTGDWNEIKRLKSQWKKDKRTVQKIRDSYSQLMNGAPIVMQVGPVTEFDFKDGACMVKKSGSRYYNTKTKEFNTVDNISREQCDATKAAFRKHQAKIMECSQTDLNIAQDIYANHKAIYGDMQMMPGSIPNQGITNTNKALGMGGGIAAGYIGGMGSGYMTGGLAGGYVTGGMGGAGMMGYNPYGGIGMGGSGMGMWLANMSMQCDMLYGGNSFGGGMIGGSGAGSTSGGAISQ